MTTRTDPARPDTPLTSDGRPMHLVTSYTRRGSRLTPKQQAAWERHADAWTVPAEVVADEGFDHRRWFGREASLVVEIGSGVGEALARLAAARPAYDVLGLEVWRPGIASSLLHLELAGATNVRLLPVDAVWALENLLSPASLAELWMFFPDPWHKKRHHKRRLVTPAFAELAASRLAPGASWRLATDWDDYAAQIQEVLDTEPALEGGPTARWEERPLTRFERRGLAAGRRVTDFRYARS